MNPTSFHTLLLGLALMLALVAGGGAVWLWRRHARAQALRRAAEAQAVERQRQEQLRAQSGRRAALAAQALQAAQLTQAETALRLRTAAASSVRAARHSAARDAERAAAEQAARDALAQAAAEQRVAERIAAVTRWVDPLPEGSGAVERAPASGQAPAFLPQPAPRRATPIAPVLPIMSTVPAAALPPLVMVVDDSKVVRVKMSRLLAQHHYRVALAEDGLQATELLRAELPVLIVTDAEMPGLDGFELARHVRKDPRTAHLPVIMITSADDRVQARADAAGVTAVLGKPFDDAVLIDSIRQAQQLSAVLACA